MEIRELSAGAEHERVVECIDRDAGYHGIVAVHSTKRGPAVGGTRLLPYDSAAAALADVLRLSRAMSYKAALAGVDFGGGKAVIIGDTRTIERERVFQAHGRFVDHFNGTFITAEDVGTSPADMAVVSRETRYAAGLVDPSPFTGRGVFRAIQAACAWHGHGDIRGRRVALQGCGNVGYALARELHAAGAEIIASDADSARLQRVVNDFHARAVDVDSIYDVEADVFAPCALGGILNDRTIPRLRVGIVAGGANNQLEAPHHGDALDRCGILYVPDYIANAGGIISGAVDISGWSRERSAEAIEAISNTVERILRLAEASGVTPAVAADRAAEELLRA